MDYQKNSGFIGLFLMIFLLGCTKGGGNVYIEGYVKNPVTGEGYADIKINLSKIQKTSLPGGYKTVKTVYTDENGYFEISHTGLTDYWARVEVDNDLYYGLGWVNNNSGGAGTYSISIDKGQNMYADYELVSFGNLKVYIDNVNCQGSDDQLRFRSKKFQSEEFGSWSTIREGCYSYHAPEYFETPMGWKIYEWEVTRSGSTSYYSDSIYLPANGEEIFVLEY